MNNFERLIEEFENKKDTHPHISTLWQAHLITQKNKLDKLIEQGNVVSSILEQQEDIPISTLLFLYFTHRFE
tara:strand:+ start:268 stop:483 length:216 start_codon:yes stop_codon:yes gene_type:complete